MCGPVIAEALMWKPDQTGIRAGRKRETQKSHSLNHGDTNRPASTEHISDH